MILSIDPGNTYSAYSLLNNDLKPVRFGKVLNEELLEIINEILLLEKQSDGTFKCNVDYAAIEMVASYGMAVGKDVFETCVWIGRFYQAIHEQGNIKPHLIYRKEEKMNLCNSMRAKDSNIRQALIDRFGPVGTKKNQGWFYGVSKDVWAAIAVGVTFHDIYLAGQGYEKEIN